MSAFVTRFGVNPLKEIGTQGDTVETGRALDCEHVEAVIVEPVEVDQVETATVASEDPRAAEAEVSGGTDLVGFGPRLWQQLACRGGTPPEQTPAQSTTAIDLS